MHRDRVAPILIALLIAAAATPAAAASEALEALRDYYAQVETLQGEFEQTTRDDRGEVVEQSAGTFAIDRPDRFRWSYAEPFPQEIVADGDRLWVYDKALAQVTVRPQGQALGSAPAQLLAGDYAGLEAAFAIEAEGDFVRLTPREEGQAFVEARLRFDGERPTALEIDDALGQTTRVALSALQVNEPVDEQRLRFEPPEGVDVYRGRVGQGRP